MKMFRFDLNDYAFRDSFYFSRFFLVPWVVTKMIIEDLDLDLVDAYALMRATSRAGYDNHPDCDTDIDFEAAMVSKLESALLLVI